MAREKMAELLLTEYNRIARAKFEQTLTEMALAVFPQFFQEIYQYVLHIVKDFKQQLSVSIVAWCSHHNS